MALTVTAKKKQQAARSVLNPVLRESGTEFGKLESRLLRKDGWVPGRIQTRDGTVFGVKFPYDEIRKVAFDRNLKCTLFTVHLQDHETMRCIVRELQVLPLQPTHVDISFLSAVLVSKPHFAPPPSCSPM